MPLSGRKAPPPRLPPTGGKEEVMRHLKRFAIALGSLAALVLAGGAHWKLG